MAPSSAPVLKVAFLFLLPLIFFTSKFAYAQSVNAIAGSLDTEFIPLDQGLKNTLLDPIPTAATNDGGLKDGASVVNPIGSGTPGFSIQVGYGNSGDDDDDEDEESSKRDFETDYKGVWVLFSKDSGVSVMHMNLLPNNKMIFFDLSAFRISNIRLPNGRCYPFKTDKGVELQDCWAHGVEFDIKNAKIRPLNMVSDPWCSSGGLDVNGGLVSTGGWMSGTKAVRYIRPCDKCDWTEYPTALARPRWYATQATMPDGGFILVGGRRSFSFEFVPAEGKSNARAIKLPFLDETTDLDENNLYPFVHLSTDGNVFIFANSRSILLNPNTHKVLREFPVLPGGSRNYPASGMSALLPIKLHLQNPAVIPAEVIVCGGAKPEAYRLAEKGTFMTALQDCARLDITKPNDVWKIEQMPSPRVMGDMLILPTGDLLILNGATSGTSAWKFAEGPNKTPAIYSPNKPAGERFKELKDTDIPRMYHSTSAVLPDGVILVGGSNTNPGYEYNAKYPTELRIEKFSPPYLDPALKRYRPAINFNAMEKVLTYGQDFEVEFKLTVKEDLIPESDIKVTMYPPPFTTHGYSMNQRLLVLAKNDVVEVSKKTYKVSLVTPPSGVIAPPGYYLLFVVYRGIPSVGSWVQIK